MEINIQTPSFNASEKLTDFTLDKVGKLEDVTERIMKADVTLRTEKSDTRENKFCEIRLAIPGNDLFASKNSETFEEAVMKTVDALKQQLVSWKERAQDHRANYKQ